MAIVQDPATLAAAAIYAETFASEWTPDRMTSERMAEIIREYSPFKQDVAYMPVPRCESCASWQQRPGFKLGCCSLTIYDSEAGWADFQSKARAMTVNDEGNMEAGLLETAADFGCVQWSEKK